jgi:hypothetical protein
MTDYTHDDVGAEQESPDLAAWRTSLLRLGYAAAQQRYPEDDFSLDRNPEPEVEEIATYIEQLEAERTLFLALYEAAEAFLAAPWELDCSRLKADVVAALDALRPVMEAENG